MSELSVRDHMRLQLADIDRGSVSWLSREGTIRHLLGESATHYYARLDRLIDDERAIACYPTLCSRLRRLRKARAAQRSGRRAG